MKLLNKLTLYNTLSKTAIVILFIWLLPLLVKDVAFQYTNFTLQEQKRKVISTINKTGIDYYFQGDSSYGSYTMLKEEYISLDAAPAGFPADTIETAKRVIDKDTLTYRVLSQVFEYHHKKYLLEIGKTIAAINQYNRPLQRVALYVLIGLIAVTLLFDLVVTRLLLRPLSLIIKTKLLNRQFPFKEEFTPVKTSTLDFKYLDASLASLMQQIKTAFEKEREFTSNASHELMTPLGILQNKMENLMDNNPDELVQEKIMGMMQTLSRLKKIVRSLLLISRIENDQYAKAGTIQMKTCVQEVLDELEDRLEATGIRTSVNIVPNLQLHQANKELLFQLLYNLVNNAIRYNKPQGEIKISDHWVAGQPYSLVIADTGIGIAAADLAFIFDRFKKSGQGNGEGYGIGLSIVKSIALYHGIDISVSSQENAGTAFTIVFPLKMVNVVPQESS